jgi:hypothetical protein
MIWQLYIPLVGVSPCSLCNEMKKLTCWLKYHSRLIYRGVARGAKSVESGVKPSLLNKRRLQVI